MIVLLVRHGESIGNKLKLYQGTTLNYDLTEKGLEQAATTAEYCNSKNIVPEVIMHSPLIRAKKTAEIICKLINNKNCELVEIEQLKEVNLGIIEGAEKTFAKESYNDLFNQLIKTQYDFSVMNGESKEEVKKRAEYIIRYCELLGKKIVMLVTHGAFIRELFTVMTGENYDLSKLSNGQVIILKNKEKGIYEIGF